MCVLCINGLIDTTSHMCSIMFHVVPFLSLTKMAVGNYLIFVHNIQLRLHNQQHNNQQHTKHTQ